MEPNQPAHIVIPQIAKSIIIKHIEESLKHGYLDRAEGMITVCIFTLCLGEDLNKYMDLVHQHRIKAINASIPTSE